MKKLLLLPALLGVIQTSNAQLALQDFNAPGIPAGWTMINDGKTPLSVSAVAPATTTALKTSAWVQIGTTDRVMFTTSIFMPSGKADRWLITPPFTVSDPEMWLTWLDRQILFKGGKRDSLEIRVGPDTATTAADFSTKLFSGLFADSISLTQRGLSLRAYNGTKIRIAFRNIGDDAGYSCLDNVQAQKIPKSELALNSITPRSGALNSFGPAGSGVTVSGVAINLGFDTVTSFKVNYQAGSSAIVTETKSVSIAPFEKATFSFATPISLTASAIPVKVWVELAGDTLKNNDSLSTIVSGYTKKPAKRIVAEEPTGTWCQWCVRGIIYFDSAHKVHPNDFSLIAVHNEDPMAVPAYDDYLSNYRAGFPSMVIDRRITSSPEKIFNYYTSEKDKFGVADIALTPTVTGTTLSMAVSVTPSADVSADYRLALVLTEDDVSGTGPDWAHANAYSGGAYGPMGNAEYDFVKLPRIVPASTMRYDFVARGVYPDVKGGAGTLPATMTTGTKYAYTFSGISLGSWNKDKMHAVVMLINNADGSILNSQSVKLTTTGLSDVNADVAELQVYPNPATELVNAKFLLNKGASVSFQVIDAMGKIVKTIDQPNLSAGTYMVPINVSMLPAGVYMLKVFSDNGTVTERFSIMK